MCKLFVEMILIRLKNVKAYILFLQYYFFAFGQIFEFCKKDALSLTLVSIWELWFCFKTIIIICCVLCFYLPIYEQNPNIGINYRTNFFFFFYCHVSNNIIPEFINSIGKRRAQTLFVRHVIKYIIILLHVRVCTHKLDQIVCIIIVNVYKYFIGIFICASNTIFRIIFI